MCLLLLAINQHPDYPLIFCGNRDEFYDRPAADAHYWGEDGQLFGGRDLEKGGTWLGLTRSGRFAAVTNVREAAAGTASATESRGKIVTDFLCSTVSGADYSRQLLKKNALYQGYNAVFGVENELYYASNRANESGKLPDGIHVLSNASLNTPWPKTEQLKTSITALLKDNRQPVDRWLEAIFDSLRDDRPYPDEMLPETGVDLERERRLSPIFIKGEKYGTRASTIVLMNRSRKFRFLEQTYGPFGQKKTRTDKQIFRRNPER
ncbi:NRDE family protein [Halalkalibacter oceani]|uniref:NRDE family protein n=1 Tax=Halalkalibacter oceani TaxID=1653776 RepID=UPI003396DB97